MQTAETLSQSRNLQLDFFRGFALMIIFINHMPNNELFHYTPSRFGLSDAAEIFVFLSGFAAAIAYGRCFERSGIWLGTTRIVHRCIQIYWSHLTLFFVLAAICVLGNRWVPEIDYIHRLNLNYFFDRTHEALFEVITLRYLPMYLDILPMYLVVVLWIPFMWMLARLHVVLALGFSALVYLGANYFGWDLPADPLSDRVWFFNPFAWQFMFFTGFAFGAGWLRPPNLHRSLIALALLWVVVSVPLGHEPTFRRFTWLLDWRLSHEPLIDKTHLGILRWLHFLALAYLMNQLFHWKAHWLRMALSRWIASMGKHSLPIFLFSTCLSYIGGMALDVAGHGALSVAGINLAGLGLMMLAAMGLTWLDAKPWKASAGWYTPNLDPSGNESATLLKLSPAWIRRAAAVPVMVCLAAAPLVLLQRTEQTDGSAPTAAARFSKSESNWQGDVVISQQELDDQFQLQDAIKWVKTSNRLR